MTGAEITSIIDVLAEKLGTTGEHLVELYTPWVVTYSTIGLIMGAMLLCVFVGLAIMAFKLESDDCSPQFVGGLLLLIGMVVAGLFAIETIPDLMNPEAAAITKVIGMLR